MISLRIQVAEPERSLWSASTTGIAPCASACFASVTPCGMVWTVVEPSSASRRRQAADAMSSATLRARAASPFVMTWNVMPTSGTSANGKPKKKFT